MGCHLLEMRVQVGESFGVASVDISDRLECLTQVGGDPDIAIIGEYRTERPIGVSQFETMVAETISELCEEGRTGEQVEIGRHQVVSEPGQGDLATPDCAARFVVAFQNRDSPAGLGQDDRRGEAVVARPYDQGVTMFGQCSTRARTLTGEPEPVTILSGDARMTVPVAGSRSRF